MRSCKREKVKGRRNAAKSSGQSEQNPMASILIRPPPRCVQPASQQSSNQLTTTTNHQHHQCPPHQSVHSYIRQQSIHSLIISFQVLQHPLPLLSACTFFLHLPSSAPLRSFPFVHQPRPSTINKTNQPPLPRPIHPLSISPHPTNQSTNQPTTSSSSASSFLCPAI